MIPSDNGVEGIGAGLAQTFILSLGSILQSYYRSRVYEAWLDTGRIWQG